MYPTILAFHSLVRWLVLLSLLYSVYRAWYGWFSDKTFTKLDDSVRHWTATIAQIQMLAGVTLYSVSPITHHFLHNFNDSLHQREIRFFGMEHATMMLTAIILISTGSARAKRKQTDSEKFRTIAIWFTIALIIILTSIPWAFSPLTSRPYFRHF